MFGLMSLASLKEVFAELKRNKWEKVTGDRQVHVGPCFVFSVAINSDGQGDADAKIHDQAGSGEGGDFLNLYTVDESTHQRDFWPPLFFVRGIYVDVGTNAESVFVHYRPHDA